MHLRIRKLDIEQLALALGVLVRARALADHARLHRPLLHVRVDARDRHDVHAVGHAALSSGDDAVEDGHTRAGKSLSEARRSECHFEQEMKMIFL